MSASSDQPKVPGLHKVGPNPWDYVFNPEVGQRVATVQSDGSLMTGTISDFNEDHEITGELKLEVVPS